jgi:hypothetical protein
MMIEILLSIFNANIIINLNLNIKLDVFYLHNIDIQHFMVFECSK